MVQRVHGKFNKVVVHSGEEVGLLLPLLLLLFVGGSDPPSKLLILLLSKGPCNAWT